MILPDLMPLGLRLVICGTAAGTASAQARAYYAGHGNRFWPTLLQTGLISEPLAPADFRRLPEFGIGLTDVSRTRYGMDHQLGAGSFDAPRLWSAVAEADPAVLAFNGKKAAKVALGLRPRDDLAYGPLVSRDRPTWVLPSTSSAGSRFWDLSVWQDLADTVRVRN